MVATRAAETAHTVTLWFINPPLFDTRIPLDRRVSVCLNNTPVFPESKPVFYFFPKKNGVTRKIKKTVFSIPLLTSR
jgi:hypothetical protein